MPRSSLRQSSPHSSQPCTRISVSDWVEKRWPQSVQRVAQIPVVIQLAVENYRDVASFIPNGLVAAGQVDNAQPPHPQSQSWRARFVHQKAFAIRPAMRHGRGHRTNARLRVLLLLAKATPQIPHTLLFDLRRGKKSSPGACHVKSKTKTRHIQTMIRIPGKQEAHEKQKQKTQRGDEQEKERFALQQQTPVEIFLPRRDKRVAGNSAIRNRRAAAARDAHARTFDSYKWGDSRGCRRWPVQILRDFANPCE